MNYAKINTHDVANGPGIRVSLFVSGCEHKCPGCFNPETWDFGYGEPFTGKEIASILESGKPEYIKGLSVLGGEPLHPWNIRAVTELVFVWKALYPNKPIWLYTGYRCCEAEAIARGFSHNTPLFWVGTVLDYIDVLVDGPFIEAEKDLSLRFRGSRNQRIIDVKKTRETGKVVLWNEEE